MLIYSHKFKGNKKQIDVPKQLSHHLFNTLNNSTKILDKKQFSRWYLSSY